MAMDSWIKMTYSQRLFLWLLSYSILLVGCFICYQFHREKRFKTDELNAQLQLINQHIIEELMEGNEPVQISISRYSLFEELRISIIDTTGHVVYDNTLDTIPHASHLSRKEIIQALHTGTGHTVRRHSESTGKYYFYSATRTANGYLIRSAVPYSLSLTELLRADFGFLWVMGGITTLMCILGYFVTRRIGLHILRLNQFAESAERGERIYNTHPFPQDELGSISNHIVRLYAHLQQANAERDREHQAALYEQQEKERIKKQLTNNINHELKTPVASIQVCIETLLMHHQIDPAKREEFLHRCLASTQRLKRLLNDISLITRMDDAPSSVIKEPIDLSALITEVVEEYAIIATSKGIEIVNNINSSLLITGNAFLLSSAFRNLIDNAIAYSGGNLIQLQQLASNSRQTVITLADNGCGVSQEHLPHLFERFYRIDKGRSRKAGGTGLGLSIVKNALLLHEGNISVANHPEGGLIFTIILPTTLS